VTRLRAGRSGLRIPVDFLLFKTSRQSLGPTQLPMRWVGLHFPSVKGPGREVGHSPNLAPWFGKGGAILPLHKSGPVYSALACPYPKKSLNRTVALRSSSWETQNLAVYITPTFHEVEALLLRSVPRRRHIRTQLHRQWSHILQAPE
jgi:hypothetical protein